VGAGLLAGYVVLLATGRRLIEATWWQIIPVAAAVIAFGAADALGGSGFIAAFVAGTVFALVAHEDTPTTMRFLEETGALLDAVTFLVFGAVLLGPALEQVSWQVLVFAALSLTVARMVPVAISLWGTHARAPTVTFMGWFGPRGLASIVFAVVVEDAHQIHSTTILTATYLTVGLSVLLHGLTGAPLVRRYLAWYAAADDRQRPTMESEAAHEHRPRGPTALLGR